MKEPTNRSRLHLQVQIFIKEKEQIVESKNIQVLRTQITNDWYYVIRINLGNYNLTIKRYKTNKVIIEFNKKI